MIQCCVTSASRAAVGILARGSTPSSAASKSLNARRFRQGSFCGPAKQYAVGLSDPELFPSHRPERHESRELPGESLIAGMGRK
jgi:hypothetical protein